MGDYIYKTLYFLSTPPEAVKVLEKKCNGTPTPGIEPGSPEGRGYLH